MMGLSEKLELINELKDHLQLRVVGGGFTDPNYRRIELVWTEGNTDIPITAVDIDIKQKREYEG